MDLKILYEDNHLIAVLKPRGVLTQGGKLDLPVLMDMVKDYIKEKYNKPGEVFLGLVHRLDTNVSGVVVFAKTSKGASRLSKEIREKRFKKKYLVVVEGNVKDENLTLTNYLYKDEVNKKAIITNKDKGKEAVLIFKKIKSENNLSLLEIELITGRFHQIRAQLSNYGYPIYGDMKYGSKVRGQKILLHASSLEFKHPTKDEVVIINSMPEDKIFNSFNLKNSN